MEESEVRCRKEIGVKGMYYILRREEKRREGAKR
jgi:hypothetical protein